MARRTFKTPEGERKRKEVMEAARKGKTSNDYVNAYVANPSGENKAEIIETVLKDPELNDLEKNQIISDIDNCFNDINAQFDAIPQSSEDLDIEAVYLSKITKSAANVTREAFYHLCQRLMILQETGDYPEGITGGMKQYVVERLKISRAIAYEFIDVFKLFALQNMPQKKAEIYLDNRKKLIPYFPIIKSKDVPISYKEKLKATIVDKISDKTVKEVREDANIIKNKYKLIKKPTYNKTELDAKIKEITENYKKGLVIVDIKWGKA